MILLKKKSTAGRCIFFYSTERNEKKKREIKQKKKGFGFRPRLRKHRNACRRVDPTLVGKKLGRIQRKKNMETNVMVLLDILFPLFETKSNPEKKFTAQSIREHVTVRNCSVAGRFFFRQTEIFTFLSGYFMVMFDFIEGKT